jgi:transcriptional regulator with XRE-family HTH domain
VNAEEALQTIARLIKDARLETGVSQVAFAKEAGLDAKTYATMEKGTRVPTENSQRKVERALKWRAGSIKKVLDDAADIPAGSVTVATMREGAGEATWADLDREETAYREGPVTRANQLTDEELLAELTYRFRNYKNRFIAGT